MTLVDELHNLPRYRSQVLSVLSRRSLHGRVRVVTMVPVPRLMEQEELRLLQRFG